MPDGLAIAEPAPQERSVIRPEASTPAVGSPSDPASNPDDRDGASTSRLRLGTILAVVITLVLLAPLLVSALDMVGVDFRPGLDHAWIELRVFDVGGDDRPLVGPYSRIGANHPGPLLFYSLALPYRLLGASSAALLSSAALVNALSVAGVAAVAFRRGRLPLLLLAGALTAVILGALGTGFFRDPWNPWMGVLPFLLFLLLVWSVADGDLPMLPLVTLVGSFLVQTHLGYAVLVAYLGLWALSGLALSMGRSWRHVDRARRRQLGKRLGVWLTLAIIVAVACWAAPLAEQATGDPGNLTALLDSLEDNDNEPVGYDAAGGFVARELSTIGPWMGASAEADALGRVRPTSAMALLVPALAFGAGVILAWWRRARPMLLLQGTVAVAVAAGFVATAMIDGTVHTYLIRWMWPIAVLLWLSVAWSAWTALDTSWKRRATFVGAPLLTLAVVGLTTATIVAESDETTPSDVWSDQILGVEADVLAALDELDDPEPVFVFSGDGSLDSYAVSVGLQLQLEKNGIAIIDPTGDPSRYGRRRTDRNQTSGANLLVVSDESIALLRQSPELDFVTSWNPRTPDQQAELTRLDQRAEAGELPPVDKRRRRDLQAVGDRIGIFVDPSPRQG